MIELFSNDSISDLFLYLEAKKLIIAEIAAGKTAVAIVNQKLYFSIINLNIFIYIISERRADESTTQKMVSSS